MSASEAKDPWEELCRLPMGQRVEISDGRGRTWIGSVVPRHEFSGERILPLKLASGYNVGLRIEPTFAYRVLASPTSAPTVGPSIPPGGPGPRGSERWVTLLSTGGTIASRVDYETGGVRPVKEEREILEFYPELERAGRVRVVPVFDKLSENLTPVDWETLANKIVEAFGEGAEGVVIAHGTDTLGFTAAALGFLLEDLPGPVVLVGAQRSPDRPSSDGASNLVAAVAVARDRRLGEVVVVMHAGLSDRRFAIHRGTWVRKMHSSRRDAFESRNGPLLGEVLDGEVRFASEVRAPSAGPARASLPLDSRGGILWFYPGLEPGRAEEFVRGMRGIVLAGTGLGHIATAHLEWIRAATARGIVVVMTTQCLEGNADAFVYSTGRQLRRAGVVFLEDLLPETAYAKLLWALGRSNDPAEVARLLLTDRAGEFCSRHFAAGSS